MIADKFIASLGVLQVDASDELKALLLEKIKLFFRMGGSIKWEELVEMDELSIELFSRAYAEVSEERSRRVAEHVVDQLSSIMAEIMKEPVK